MNIRLKTCLIVRRDGKYLRCRNQITHMLDWSISPYEAWRTRNKEEALKVASKVGGTLCLFNPIASQIMKYERRQKVGK